MIRNLIALLFGLVGTLLILIGIHLYNDHLNLHGLINLEVQRQQQMQKSTGS